MNILITGGLGVNGSFVTRKLIERGIRPVLFENRVDTALLKDCEDGFTLIEGDILDLDRLSAAIGDHRIERVIHMAALMPDAAQADMALGWAVNATGTVNVLEAARRCGVARVIFTSSRAVYGETAPAIHRHPTYAPIGEDHPFNPQIVYDVTKVASEGMGLNYRREYGIEFVALRFAAIYGPGRLARHGSVSILSLLVENPMAGLPARLPRGGDQRDDFIYVDDVAEGVAAAALSERPAHTAYNIVSGTGHTLMDFADAVREVIPGADIEIGPGLGFFDAGVDYHAVFDPSRAREDLGFVARYSLSDGVRAYVETMARLGIDPTTTDPAS